MKSYINAINAVISVVVLFAGNGFTQGTYYMHRPLTVKGKVVADTIKAESNKPMGMYNAAPIHGRSNPTSGLYSCGVSGYTEASSGVTGFAAGVMGYDNNAQAQQGNIGGFFTSNGGSGNRYGILVDMDGPSPTNYPTGKWAAALHGDVFVEGKLKIKGWTIEAPDYVFDNDYKLRDLKEVEKFITENKHLPEVPSAKEMKEKGLDMTEMNFHLLKKIEELTLYVIQQQKEIDQLKKQATE